MSKTNRDLSISQLEKLLNSRKFELTVLIKKKAKLSDELAAVEKRIDLLSGSNGKAPHAGIRRKGQKRLKNEKTLHATACELLARSNKGFLLAEIHEKIVAGGYKSRSKNFKNVVYQTLFHSDDIKHDSNSGLYSLKRTARK